MPFICILLLGVPYSRMQCNPSLDLPLIAPYDIVFNHLAFSQLMISRDAYYALFCILASDNFIVYSAPFSFSQGWALAPDPRGFLYEEFLIHVNLLCFHYDSP